jgi:hypothetical protein
MIQLEYVADGLYVVYHNKKELGTFVQYEDGYFNFLPKALPGYWSSYALRVIADELDRLNTEWDQYIQNNLIDGE